MKKRAGAKRTDFFFEHTSSRATDFFLPRREVLSRIFCSYRGTPTMTEVFYPPCCCRARHTIMKERGLKGYYVTAVKNKCFLMTLCKFRLHFVHNCTLSILFSPHCEIELFTGKNPSRFEVVLLNSCVHCMWSEERPIVLSSSYR